MVTICQKSINVCYSNTHNLFLVDTVLIHSLYLWFNSSLTVLVGLCLMFIICKRLVVEPNKRVIKTV